MHVEISSEGVIHINKERPGATQFSVDRKTYEFLEKQPQVDMSYFIISDFCCTIEEAKNLINILNQTLNLN